MAHRLPVWLTPREAAAVLAAARSARDHAIVATGLYCGLRLHELSSLNVEHVDLGAGFLLVLRGKGAKDRYVAMPDDLRRILGAYVGSRRKGPMFTQLVTAGAPRRLSDHGIYEMVRGCGRRAGIQKRCTPHVLRHTCATTLLQNGVDIVQVSRYLGHVSVQTTLIYLHCDPERQRSAAQRLNGAFAPQLQARLWAVG